MLLYRILGIVFLVLLITTFVAMGQRFRYRAPAWAGWVHGLAVINVGATLILLCIGGLVTSYNAGMAVPDWPNSYGYNMFLFPVSGWVGGIFYEHTHRLWASGVGLLTTLLAFGLAWTDHRRWLRWTGLGALLLVIIQGLFGGFRVTENSAVLAIIHGCLAQAFFVLCAFIALATSHWWKDVSRRLPRLAAERKVAWFILVVCGFIVVQLILGATMRHAQMGLAVPDFPLAYGQLWPNTSGENFAEIEQFRRENIMLDTTKAQIHIHMTHRFMALVIFFGILFCVDRVIRYPSAPVLKRGAWMWMTLVLIQICLGAWTVWSDKAADIASIHVAVGALTLVTGVLLAVMVLRISSTGEVAVSEEGKVTDSGIAASKAGALG